MSHLSPGFEGENHPSPGFEGVSHHSPGVLSSLPSLQTDATDKELASCLCVWGELLNGNITLQEPTHRYDQHTGGHPIESCPPNPTHIACPIRLYYN